MIERTHGAVHVRAGQRASALAKANRVRMTRASVRRRLKAGEIDLGSALELAGSTSPASRWLD